MNLEEFKKSIICEKCGRVKDFTDQELREALIKGKEIYENEHPETVQGSQIVQGEKGFQNKESQLQTKFATSYRKEKSSHRVKPAKRFTEKMADLLKISETSIKNYLRIAEAMKKGLVPEEMKKEKPYKIIEYLRKRKNEN